jgi:hypothetical protein
MSKKKDRAWFVCPQWTALITQHYPDDVAAARALRTDLKVLTRLRQGTPMARSNLLKLLRRFSRLHPIQTSTDDLIKDTRSH